MYVWHGTAGDHVAPLSHVALCSFWTNQAMFENLQVFLYSLFSARFDCEAGLSSSCWLSTVCAGLVDALVHAQMHKDTRLLLICYTRLLSSAWYHHWRC